MHYIMLPSRLVGFANDSTEIVKTTADREMYLLRGHCKVAVIKAAALNVARPCTSTTTVK